ncbi:hypothetical protein LTR84_004306 [Exophiala bonariae]|uniref:Uncharacterized protein n=1 Tax=Exophiala bonariae TaxID=1690606 RepID=A0AAV9N7R2_9EURO|nr:hypothetical protein LTR84_004306 [Exophiala bonariae]
MASVDQSLLGTFQKHIEDMRTNWFGGAQGRRKNRNCPDCRAVVTIQPSPNYLLRDLVHMFIGRVELLPEDETFEEHQQGKEEEAALLAADRAGPGLFKGAFVRQSLLLRLGGGGVLDPEDNVYRCPECHWELEDGECLQCGFREYEAGGESLSDSSDDLSDDPSLATIHTDYDSEGHEMSHLDAHTMAGLHDDRFADLAPPYWGNESDEEDDDDDEDMDGFLDDEDDGIDSDDDQASQATLTDAHHHTFHNANHRAAHHRHQHIEVDLRSPDHHRTDDTGTQTTNYDEQSDVATNYDEQTEESDQEDDIRPSQRASRRPTRIIISDDEDDGDGEHDGGPDGEPESSSDSEETSGDPDSSDGSDEDDSDDGGNGAAHGGPEDMDQHYNTEDGDSFSDNSDGTEIQPPQSIARRRQHLQNQRSRRADTMRTKSDYRTDMSNATLERLGHAVFRNSMSRDIRNARRGRRAI